MKIVFVCTGNLCRSPMAEALLRHALQEAGCEGIEVASSGTWAMSGNPTTQEAAEALAALEIDLSAHRSRPWDPQEVFDADLVVAMTSVHVREILSIVPQAAPKVVLLKELAEIEPQQIPQGSTSEERLQALLQGKRPKRKRHHDLDDPMGLPLSAYQRAVTELQAGIDVLAKTLC